MVIEDVFGTAIPDDVGNDFGSVNEIVNSLYAQLSTQRPNNQAVKLLRKIAVSQTRPEIAEGVEGTWRREQIAAILRELFKEL